MESEFNKLPLAAQQSIKTQMLVNKMRAYGRKKVVLGQFSSQEATFTNYKNIRTPDLEKGFVELEKGCELWMDNEKYPIRSCQDSDRINTVHRFKRFIASAIKSFSGWKTVIGVPFFLINKDNYIDALWNAMQDVYYADEKFYCQPVREIYRVMSKLNFDNKVRDIGCAVLEFDTGYRYPFQDIFFEFNKDNLLENPIKEIKRVLNILLQRAGDGGIGRFKKQIPYLLFYLEFINRKILNQIVSFILEANINEIKMSKEDIYWTNAKTVNDYQFRGTTLEQRTKEYNLERSV